MRDMLTTALELLGLLIIVVSLAFWQPIVAGIVGGAGLIVLGFLLAAAPSDVEPS